MNLDINPRAITCPLMRLAMFTHDDFATPFTGPLTSAEVTT